MKIEKRFTARTENFSRYLNDVKDSRGLSPDDEAAFFYEYNETTDPETREAMKKDFLSRNQLILVSVAKRYSGDPSVQMDLICEGECGMSEAFDNFDVTRGYRFVTFAVRYITRSMYLYINRTAPAIRRSNDMRIGGKLARKKQKFFGQNGRDPSNDEIREMFKNDNNIRIVNDSDLDDITLYSFNNSVDDDSDSTESYGWLETRTASENGVNGDIDVEYKRDMISKAMLVLNEREREVITLMFGLEDGIERSAEDISDIPICGRCLTAARINQIRNSAIAKMQGIKKHLCA